MVNQLQIVYFNSLSRGFIVVCPSPALFSIFIIAVDRGTENMFINFSDDPNLEGVTWRTVK